MASSIDFSTVGLVICELSYLISVFAQYALMTMEYHQVWFVTSELQIA